jgi:GNAT superfamily N-acetyltransferase
VLEDGATVRVRPAGRADVGRVADLLVGLSVESRTQRFLTGAAQGRERMAEYLGDLGRPEHLALVAEQDGRLVGVVEALVAPAGDVAEVAFEVADADQGRGLGTLLLEHLVAVARTRGIRRLVATTMARNGRMLATFRDAGFAETTATHVGVVEVTLDIGPHTEVPRRGGSPVPEATPPSRSWLGALRALAVMSGGMVVLVVAVVAALVVAIAAVVGGEAPPVPATVVLFAAALYALVLLPWTRRWGTRAGEVDAVLPGDEYVPRAGLRMTRAVTVDAPPETVWRWLAQIGADRAGFYSHAWLANLAGCRLRNADRVHPEWQHREVGELVWLHPLNGIPITRLEAPWCFAMGGWYFVLEARPHGRTRLLARTRVPRGLPSVAYALLVELPHFVMERKMLLGLRRRAEALPSVDTDRVDTATRVAKEATP